MKTLTLLSLALLWYSCSSTQSVEAKKEEIQHTLDGQWVILQHFNSPTLILLNQETYRPEIFPVYNCLAFDKKNQTIKTHTVGEFGVADNVSLSLDLSEVRWSLNEDKLHIHGHYRDYGGPHTLNSFYTVDRKRDTLFLRQL